MLFTYHFMHVYWNDRGEHWNLDDSRTFVTSFNASVIVINEPHEYQDLS